MKHEKIWTIAACIGLTAYTLYMIDWFLTELVK
jgi:hypothetical protein